MLNCVYRLIAPRTFEPVMIDTLLTEELVVVRPTHLSICNADMRYYQGDRSAKVLAKKLPMALIHEGIGTVVGDPANVFSHGARVVMIPNNPHEENPVIEENYLPSSSFCGSGYDGFMQELMVLPRHRLLELPHDIDSSVAAFTELVSVAVHAVSRFDETAHSRRSRIGIWGDGNLGFIVGLVLRWRYPNVHLVVIGRNAQKLNDFTFVDETHLADDLKANISIDHAFECCGGDGSAVALDQIVRVVNPKGCIFLLGVSENPVPIHTRLVLEKGLCLLGSSRSGRKDFMETIAMYQQKPEMLAYLSSLVASIHEVKSIAQMVQAFEADMKKTMGKTVIAWNV